MTTDTIHLADLLGNPTDRSPPPPLRLDASQTSTQTLGVIAAKGAGKSYLGSKLCEGLAAAGAPFVVLDPVGNWSSLTLAANGTDPGLDLIVIGGDRADVALDLEGDTVQKTACFLLENGFSAVLDLSELSKSKRKGVVADFCEALFQTARAQRTPYTVVLEEAQLFAPQHAARGEERMLGAVTDIVRLGRNYGLGSVMLTQRPQSVSKEVLNQVECLFVGQLRGPQERKAISGWLTEVASLDREGERHLVKEQLAALPALSPGEFFCWSPSWLRLFAKVKVRAKETYDGSSTPVLGERAVKASRSASRGESVARLLALLEPSVGPVVDPAEVNPAEIELVESALDREHWAAAGPRLKRAEEQVQVLLEENAELSRMLGEAQAQLGLEKANVSELRGLVRTAGLEVSQTVQHVSSRLMELATTIQSYADPAGAMVERSRTPLVDVARQGAKASSEPSGVAWNRVVGSQGGGPAHDPHSTKLRSAAGLSKGERSVLAVLAWQSPCSKAKLALLAGYSPEGGGFNNVLSQLRAAGRIEGSAELLITKAGQVAIGDVARPPTGPALLDWWLAHARVDTCMAAILEALRKARRPLEKGELSARSLNPATGMGYSAKAGGFNNALSKLRTLGLVRGKGSQKLELAEELRP